MAISFSISFCNCYREYQAPSADIGSPDGYELQPVGIPEYGDGGNNGGWGRGGGGGGGGGGGDPMKGFTYLFALLLFVKRNLYTHITKMHMKSSPIALYNKPINAY